MNSNEIKEEIEHLERDSDLNIDSILEINDNSSFNNKFDILYENHLEKGNLNSELNNNIRPISPHHNLNLPSSAKNNQIEQIRLISLINQQLQNKYKSINNLFDNPQLFYNYSEIKDSLIKEKIKGIDENLFFSILDQENPFREEKYILGKTLMNKFKQNKENRENSQQSFENSRTNNEKIYKNNSKNDSNAEHNSFLKQINEDFKNLQLEVLDIVTNVQRAKSTTKFTKTRPMTNQSKTASGKQSALSRPITSLKNENFSTNKGFAVLKPISALGQQRSQRRTATPNASHLKLASPRSYLSETLQRKKLEDDMLKLTIEKRNKEFERECIKKMTLANEICAKNGIPKSYSAHINEEEGVLCCQEFDKNSKNSLKIELKEFLRFFKKLERLENIKEKTKYYKKTEELTEKTENAFNLLKLTRKERQNEIKKVLLSSVKLKLILKKQLKALRNKELIDPDIISNSLRLTNLDDDNIL